MLSNIVFTMNTSFCSLFPLVIPLTFQWYSFKFSLRQQYNQIAQIHRLICAFVVEIYIGINITCTDPEEG